MPQSQVLERDAFQYQIDKLETTIPSESTPPSQFSENASKLSESNASLVNQRLIQILDANPFVYCKYAGFQPLNEFDTEHLVAMYFI